MLANAISVRDGVKAAYGFIPTAWKAAPGALALIAVTSVLYFYADTAKLGFVALLAALLVHIAGSAVAQGALLRLGLGKPGIGPLGLQWRGVETRLLGLSLLMMLLFVVVVLVLAIVVGALIIGLSVATGAEFRPTDPDWMTSLGVVGGLALAVIVLGVYWLFIWLAVRLTLATVVTVASDRIQLLSTFALTRGSAWKIFLSVIVVALPLAAISIVGGLLTGFGGPSPSPGAGLVSIVLGVLIAAVNVPAICGLLVYLYRAIAPAETT